jgi:hypothetical protein
MKHHFLTDEQLQRYDEQIKIDKIEKEVCQDPTLLEVIYAGLWLVEQLRAIQCPDEYIVRIQYSAGAASFGRDTWEVHQHYLQAYHNNEVEFEQDLDNLN